MRFIYSLFLLLLVLFSCNKNKKNDIDVSDVQINLKIDRFEQEFYNSNEKNLSRLRLKYPFLFPDGFTDSIAVSKINNSDEQELFSETETLYSDFSRQNRKLIDFFKHVKYYNPDFIPPRIITVLSNIDYQNRIILSDSLLFVSLDAYLGEEHPFYESFPNYIKQNTTPEHLVVDVAKAFVNAQVRQQKGRTFVEKMIIEGKRMYVLDLYLPKISDYEKIGYSESKMNWAEDNEAEIWAYFIENKLLFSTESDLSKRFLDLAPFSKFYMQTDRLSPGQIGVWIGWQIVRSYAENNDLSLQSILEKKPIALFEQSKYKPKK